jgi:integrase
MELLTDELRKVLPPLYSQEHNKDPTVHIKFFTPDSNWTWYVTEGSEEEEGDFRFFGLVIGQAEEWGYFLLSELTAAHGPAGLAIERDLYSELDPTMRFAELATRFLGSGSAKDWHRERLTMLLPYFADFAIGKITKGAIRQYRQERHRQKTLTETTVNRDIECLRHLLYWSVDEGLLPANPIARIRLERERRKKKPVLSVDEETLLLSAASSHLSQIVTVALDTGMRRGEILHQTWEDVDFPRRLLYVTHSKTPEGEAREIPLTERVHTLFSSMKKDSGLIFTFDGKPIFSLKTAWKTAIRKAGIRYIRFHYLRHTFNTRLLELSVPREVRMALLGHTFGDTHESYEHVELPLKREAIRKLETWRIAETEKKGDTHANGAGPDHDSDTGPGTRSSTDAHPAV